MLKHLTGFAISVSLLIVPAVSNASTYGNGSTYGNATYGDSNLHEYTTEAAAQRHCPNDIVVWLNTHTGIWHLQGERWYGRTRQGAYVCKGEAAKAGDRETHNGQ